MCFEMPRPNDRKIPMEHTATFLGATCCLRLATVLRYVVTCWVLVAQVLKMVKFETTTPKMSQHIATRWPNPCNLRPTMLQHVVLASFCDRLAGA